MATKESDLLQFENELLNTRQELNKLIREYAYERNSPQDAAIWQDKMHYFETELKYLNNQLQLLKNTPYQAPVPNTQQPGQKGVLSVQFPKHDALPEHAPAAQPVPQAPYAHTAPPPAPAAAQTVSRQPSPLPGRPAATAAPAGTQSSTRDYEKLFGRNFMGIFASVLIFISLIIFATLMLPYLTDTMKLIGLYAVSFGILLSGYLPARKNRNNKFYITLIGCGIGSLYISLLLSDLYFKVISDITLYILILVWAVFIRYLSGLKNMVFHIIGQSGILISTILGTVLCVHDTDAAKFAALTVFYFLSALVFSGRDRTSYVRNLCNHICKSLNLVVIAAGFSCMKPTDFGTVHIIMVMLCMLPEFYFSYQDEYRHGIAFQLLTIANTVTLIFLFGLTELFSKDSVYAFMYITALAMLFYVHRKRAADEIVSEVFFLIVIYLGCHSHPFLQHHLYAYLTAIPAMLYGKMRGRKLYLYAGIAYAAELLLLALSGSDPYTAAGFSMAPYAEYLIMTAAVYLVFLFICRTVDQVPFKITGYILSSVILAVFVHDSSYQFMKYCNMEHIRTIEDITGKAILIPFFLLAVIHLLMTAFNRPGNEKPVKSMMLIINALLMATGCACIGCRPWKPASILITALLFLINSRRILGCHQNAGYYIAFKYTVFMVCVLTSYDVTDYVVSISLLLFAIVSIIVGFYRGAVTFRLYGLILSMISIVKLIMIDIRYDSTMENAVSFFVSGILCFAISFLYHKIDTNFRDK